MAANQPIINRLTWCSEIFQIEHAAQLLPWSEELLKSCFTATYQNFGYWSPSAELLGFALVQTMDDCWTIMNIVTKPSAQRQGVATQLLRHIQGCAAEQSADIVLEVRVSNSAALGLYESSGFALIGRRKGYYPTASHDREDALVMRWSAA
jgi:ribosomal-protein-alanine N-acetyltransferase